MQNIGVFGASFNPPTLGHRDVLIQAAPEFDEILLVPSVWHAFGKQLISLEHRLAMLTLFISELPFGRHPKITISRIEETLLKRNQGQGPIYTYDVLKALDLHYQKEKQNVQLRFILGPDNSNPTVWQKFYRYQDIENEWPLFVAKENLPIHSTMVREICMTAQDDKVLQQKLVKLLGEKIAEYITLHKLYQSDPRHEH